MTAPEPKASSWSSRLLRAAALPVLLCSAGLLVGHQEELLSGLRMQQCDVGDTRFINYTLEHELRWLLRDPAHPEFWNRPYFFPAEKVGGYADVMPATLPAYALWRISFPVDTAFELWGLTVGVFNWLAMYLLLRRAGRLSQLASGAGASLFAFANLRINMSMHWQMFSQYWSVLCLFAIWAALADEPLGGGRRRWIWLAAGALVAQLWSGYYLGWFLVFGLAVAAPFALAMPSVRRALGRTLRAHWATVLAAGAVTGALLYPLARGYLDAAGEQGMRPFGEVMTMISPPQVWMNLGGSNIIYGKLNQVWPALRQISMEHEQRNGVGVLTTLLVLAGFIAARKRPGALIAAGTLFVVALAVTRFNDFTLWRWVYEYFPGAQAIRAASRVGLLVLLPASVGLGLGIEAVTRLRVGRAATPIAAVLILASLAEQAHATCTFDRVEVRRGIDSIVRAIPPGCDAFVTSPVGDYRDPYFKHQIDAMFAQLRTGVPTLNGYSGHNPEGWDLTDIRINSEADERAARGRVDNWVRGRGIDKLKVCHVYVGYGSGQYDAEFKTPAASITVPAGGVVPLRFEVKNLGNETWPAMGRVGLALQFDRDQRLFGGGGVPLPREVKPGETAAIDFALRAPSAPGSYSPQFRMAAQGHGWFGGLAPAMRIEVFETQVR